MSPCLSVFQPSIETHAPGDCANAGAPDNLPGQVQRDVEQRHERPREGQPAARLWPRAGGRPRARDAAKVEPRGVNAADGRTRAMAV